MIWSHFGAFSETFVDTLGRTLNGVFLMITKFPACSRAHDPRKLTIPDFEVSVHMCTLTICTDSCVTCDTDLKHALSYFSDSGYS